MNYWEDPKFATRLWSKVDRSGDGCWEWQGYRTKFGHGQLGYGHAHVLYVHRAVYELTNGPIPAGGVVRHTCDNPACARPDHLELGTHADNVADAVSRGRNAKGERQVHRFTEEQIRDIVQRYLAGEWSKSLAAEYGLKYQNISRIVRGDRWGHLWTAEELQHMREVARSRQGRGRWRNARKGDK